jgi:hypothetical protein
MVAKYRYVFLTLRDERVIQEIDLYGVYMSHSLNGADSQFDGTFQLDQTGKRNVDLIEATHPGRTFVVVERNGIPVGAWIIWSRVYSAQSKTLQMHGISFESYPRRQRIISNTVYTDMEQVLLFKTLWTDMMIVAGRNINIIIPSGPSTPVTKSVEVYPYEVKYYGEVMSSISDSSDGFDWRIAVVKDGQWYRKDLLIGYPYLGTGVHPGMPTFDYPGNITQYYMTESMADAGTHVLTVGAGEGTDMLAAEVAHTDLIAGGFPRWDIDVVRKDIDNTALLATVANAQGIIRRPPMVTVKVTVKGDRVPEIGSFSLGDTARVTIQDARNPEGFEKDMRLVAWKVRPPTSEQVEEADLIFEGDEIA